MWAHDVDTPDYARRLDAVERSIRGRTETEEP